MVYQYIILGLLVIFFLIFDFTRPYTPKEIYL